MRISFIFAWYDFWVGFYWDRAKSMTRTDYGGASTCPACGACSTLLNIGECEYCGERGCSSCMLQESDGTSWRLDCGCREDRAEAHRERGEDWP